MNRKLFYTVRPKTFWICQCKESVLYLQIYWNLGIFNLFFKSATKGQVPLVLLFWYIPLTMFVGVGEMMMEYDQYCPQWSIWFPGMVPFFSTGQTTGSLTHILNCSFIMITLHLIEWNCWGMQFHLQVWWLWIAREFVIKASQLDEFCYRP